MQTHTYINESYNFHILGIIYTPDTDTQTHQLHYLTLKPFSHMYAIGNTHAYMCRSVYIIYD